MLHSHRLSILILAFAVSLCGCAASLPPAHHQAGELQKFAVIIEGHPFSVWSRQVPNAKGSIVLLHGRTWSALPDFDLQVPGDQRSTMMALNERGYTTYAYDMRGYGSTPRDATGWLTPDRAAADLAGVLQWVNDHEHRAPVLIGWSQGSIVAHLTVQDHPQLVSDLILYGYPRDPAVQIPVTASPEAPLREINTQQRAASDFISPAVTPQQVIDVYVKTALAADPVRADWRELEQFNALDPARITVPTLLIHGERDPLTPGAAQARLFTQLGTADKQWVVLPGADHAALLENTSPAFVAAVISFIERPRPRHETQ